MADLSPDLFDRFAEYLYGQSGIRLQHRKAAALSSRIDRQMKRAGFDDAEAFLRHIRLPAGADDRRRLIDSITIGETSFYRTPQHFDWLSREYLPAMAAAHRRGERPASLKFWSAACSSGAEAYTLAIILSGQTIRMPNWQFSILGTDIADTMIDQARTGRFRVRTLDHVPPAQIRRCFRPCVDRDDWVEISERYRRMVQFERHNLMDSPSRGLMGRHKPFDCVWLRNVLIYFDERSKQTALNNVAESLSPGGYLVIGPSEGIFGIDHPLKKIKPFLYQKP